MKKYYGFILLAALVMILVFVYNGGFSNPFAPKDDTQFSTHLYAKFQAKSCLGCHDYFEKKLGGLSFTTHVEHTAEKCVECHKQEVTGFLIPEDWFARPGLYTSAMDAKETCEAIKVGLHAQFKHKNRLAKDLAQHLFESPRVLWGIAGATPNSGRLPEGQIEKGLVQGGLAEWKTQVTLWIQGGMKCD